MTNRLKPIGKVSTKKTIRKMTPMARKLAHLTRATASIVKRLSYLTEELQRLEMANSAAGRENVELRQRLRGRDPALGPELPNGEGIGPDLVGLSPAEVQEILAEESGLTESEVLQGREAPRGCDPVTPGEGARS
jgi:hypothetical protein